MMKTHNSHHEADTNPTHRDIGIAGAFSIGIGGIGGGGIFATLGLASSQARGATFLSFAVGGLVALLTAYSYVRLSLTYPDEGGTVTFLNRAFGNSRVCEVVWCSGTFRVFYHAFSDKNREIFWKNKWSLRVKVATKALF